MWACRRAFATAQRALSWSRRRMASQPDWDACCRTPRGAAPWANSAASMSSPIMAGRPLPNAWKASIGRSWRPGPENGQANERASAAEPVRSGDRASAGHYRRLASAGLRRGWPIHADARAQPRRARSRRHSGRPFVDGKLRQARGRGGGDTDGTAPRGEASAARFSDRQAAVDDQDGLQVVVRGVSRPTRGRRNRLYRVAAVPRPLTDAAQAALAGSL